MKRPEGYSQMTPIFPLDLPLNSTDGKSELRRAMSRICCIAGLSVCLFTSSWANYPDDEPSDFEVWSAIATSLLRWREAKRRRELRRKRASSVCCFQDEQSYLNVLPSPPKEIGTRFLLYTRHNLRDPEMLQPNARAISMPVFNASNPVKIIIHGFGSSAKRTWVNRMVEALLSNGDVNVVVVDWEKGASLPNYVQAAANARLVGKQVAQMMFGLMREHGVSRKDFHLVGFSLGAHVAGFAGAEVRNISRITGLDPAAPLFEGYDPNVRLDPSDAELVDVIHSNGDSFLKGGLGAYEPMGHIDYYPNGGKVQQGCNNVFIGAITDIFSGNWHSLCHHRRAFKFFIDSVQPTCPFVAFSCDSYESFLKGNCFPCENPAKCSYMGYYADRTSGRGKMYLITRQDEPYCANQFKIIINSSSGQESTYGKLDITLFTASGSNETLSLTSESQEIKEGEAVQALVVVHPTIVNVTRIILKYTKYRGWIYNGKDVWFIDKVSVLDSFGYMVSLCEAHTGLKDAEPVKLKMQPEDCSVEYPSPTRAARLVWTVIGEPILGPQPQPPKLYLRFVYGADQTHWK